MHDPKGVAHEIRRPWRDAPSKMWPKGYRPSIITIWHVDPEKDGTDNSCGWAFPKLTERQLERLKGLAWHEGMYPYFMRCEAKDWTGTRTEAEALYRALILHVARAIEVPMTFDAAAKRAAQRIHFPESWDAAKAFCFLPGYHTNYETATAKDREEVFMGTVSGIARGILADRRPWYRHPRWHFWHWEFQFHPIQQFKRWAFSRCAGCGNRFTWGYSPVSHQWDSDGPRWFRGERGVFHEKCSGNCVAKPQAEAVPA